MRKLDSFHTVEWPKRNLYEEMSCHTPIFYNCVEPSRTAAVAAVKMKTGAKFPSACAKDNIICICLQRNCVAVSISIRLAKPRQSYCSRRVPFTPVHSLHPMPGESYLELLLEQTWWMFDQFTPVPPWKSLFFFFFFFFVTCVLEGTRTCTPVVSYIF